MENNSYETTKYNNPLYCDSVGTEKKELKPSRAKAKALAKLVKKNKGNIYAIFENVKE